MAGSGVEFWRASPLYPAHAEFGGWSVVIDAETSNVGGVGFIVDGSRAPSKKSLIED